MKSFLGIPLESRIETDDEYVERIRKQDRTRKKTAILWPVIAAITLGVFVGIFWLLQKTAETIGGIKGVAPDSKPYLWAGFLTGFLFGAWAALVLVKTGLAICHWREAKRGFRTERLLLKYHDMANRK